MNKKQKDYLIYKELYNEATTFYDYALKGFSDNKSKENHSLIPYIVNLTICCELYLKFLLLNENNPVEELKKKGHDIQSLFNLLNDNTQKIIYAKLISDSQFSKDDLLIFLKESKNAFTEWRYLALNYFDNKNKILKFQPGIAKELNIILQEICSKQLKSLKYI